MSWTECFPVMDESMVEEFEELATAEERAQLEEWYGVKEVINRQDKRHVLAMSLFWKPSAASKRVYPKPTRRVLKNAGELGLDLRFEPWPHYIQPILDEAPKLLSTHDDVAVRIYLAADLAFLVRDLVSAGCEVFLMRHPSVAHAPGIAWRVLAFGDRDRLVTMVDSDRLREASFDLDRTRAMERTGLAAWRVPVCCDWDGRGQVPYKAMVGAQVGAKGGWEMARLLHAFTWHMIRGTIPLAVEVPGCGMYPINNGAWPDYGFEEWFLTVVMYPRMAGAGILTFVPASAHSALLTLDVEYATWSNAESQLVYFPVARCCASPAGNGQQAAGGAYGETAPPAAESAEQMPR